MNKRLAELAELTAAAVLAAAAGSVNRGAYLTRETAAGNMSAINTSAPRRHSRSQVASGGDLTRRRATRSHAKDDEGRSVGLPLAPPPSWLRKAEQRCCHSTFPHCGLEPPPFLLLLLLLLFFFFSKISSGVAYLYGS